MLLRMCNNGNSPPLLEGMQTCTTIMEINMSFPQKIVKWSTSRPSYTILRHIPKWCSCLPQGHLLNHIHSNFIHNSQKPETTKISLNREMAKENVVHLYNGILLSYWKNDLMKFVNLQMGGTRKRHPDSCNLNSERQIRYVFTYKTLNKW